jgi:hypothetical protein
MGRKAVVAYRGSHCFGLAPAELWAAIERFERFEGWWSWLTEFRWEGDGLVEGSVLSGIVAPPVPYRMRVQVELVRCEKPRCVDARVSGDLEGDAHMVIRRERRGSIVEASWTIEMMQPAMRVADRVAHPLLCWGHDRVVSMTVAGFRRHVERSSSIDPGRYRKDG